MVHDEIDTSLSAYINNILTKFQHNWPSILWLIHLKSIFSPNSIFGSYSHIHDPVKFLWTKSDKSIIRHLPTKFQLDRLCSSGEEVFYNKIYFLSNLHIHDPVKLISTNLHLGISGHLPTKFQLNVLYSFGEVDF